MDRYVPTEGMSPLSLDFSPRAGMATLSLLIFHRWGRGWEIIISSCFYGAARQVHQCCNCLKSLGSGLGLLQLVIKSQISNIKHLKVRWILKSESCSVVSNSMTPRTVTVHGILQARILEWVAFPFFRGSNRPRDQTQVSRIAGRFFTSWATREAQEYWSV